MSESLSLPQKYGVNRVGLWRPNNLDRSLQVIAKYNKNGPVWSNPEDTLNATAYYVLYPLLVDLSQNTPQEHTPYSGSERFHLPQHLKNHPLDILRFGCATETSYRQELEALNALGVQVGSHMTVDMSLIPLRRIGLTELSDNQQIVSADIANMPFPPNTFDLVTTDMLFGYMARDKENTMLQNIKRVSKPGANLIMKIYTKLNGMKNVGEICRSLAIKQYGLDKNGDRDAYVGLTEQQWLELGNRMLKFSQNVHFSPNVFDNWKQIQDFLDQNGFPIEEAYLYGNDKLLEPDDKGFFMVRCGVDKKEVDVRTL